MTVEDVAATQPQECKKCRKQLPLDELYEFGGLNGGKGLFCLDCMGFVGASALQFSTSVGPSTFLKDLLDDMVTIPQQPSLS